MSDTVADAGSPPAKSGFRLLAVVFVSLALAIAGAGWWYQQWQAKNYAAAAHERLQSIASLKVYQIVNWWDRRLDDAEYLLGNIGVSTLVQAILKNPDDHASRREMLTVLAALQASNRYEQAALFDQDGRQIISIPPCPPIAAPLTNAELLIGARRREVTVRDLQKDPVSGQVFLDLLIPIRPAAAPDSDTAARASATPAPGVILLRINAQRYLYPLVQSWPSPSPSAETLLVRRDDDKVVFLNELRHRKDTALAFSLPLNKNPLLPAAQAVQGVRGVMEGTDYRGIPVLAVLADIPRTEWLMVSKVDREEVFSPLRKQAALTWSLIGAMILAAGLATTMLWVRRDRGWLQRQLQNERQRQGLAARLLAFTERAGDLILLADSELRITEANASAQKAYGYSLEEIRQRTLPELVCPDLRDRLSERIGNLNAENGCCSFESLHRRANGDSFPAECSLAMLLMNGERHYQCVVRDVTERVKISEAVRRSEEKLRAFFSSSIVGSVMGTINGDLVYVNDEYLRIVGYSRHEIESGAVNWHELTAPEFRQIERMHIQEAHRSGACSPYEKQYIRRDGSRIWVLVGYVIVGEKHEDTVAFILDISERKQVEEELRENQARLQMSQQLGRVGCWEYDIARRLFWATEECYRIHGLTPQEGYVAEHTFTSRLMERELTEQELHQAALGLSEGFHLDCTIRTDGMPRYLVNNAIVLRDGKNRPVRLIGFTQDITEHRQAELEIRALNTELTRINLELEERVRVRTSELQNRNEELQESNQRILALSQDLHRNNEELQATTQMLTAANFELEAFSYSVSHDLRAPLRGLDGFSEALLEDYAPALDERGRNYLNRLRAGAQRMGILIDDLLKLSRVSRSEMQTRPVDLSALAEAAIRQLRECEPERAIEVLIEPNLCAYGDPTLLQVILDNLLGNAWKFTSRTPEACIQFLRVDERAGCPAKTSESDAVAEIQSAANAPGACDSDNLRVQAFCVRDNGAGFDMTYASKLFGAFQRLHNSSEFEGTGIGLATVKRIVARHGGQVWAEGKIGRGASFCFSLPEPATEPPATAAGSESFRQAAPLAVTASAGTYTPPSRAEEPVL